MQEYHSDEAPGAPAVDRVGLGSISGTIPDWRAVASLAWKRNAWQLSATGRFVAGYDDVVAMTGLRNGRRIPSQSLLDVQASWDVGRSFGAASGWLEDFTIAAGVSNALDETPPFAELGVSTGYDSSQGDLRGRFGYVEIRKTF